ncbi:MAG: hypothetical protein WKF55_05170 [Gemmatimonadaceae bacterium]
MTRTDRAFAYCLQARVSTSLVLAVTGMVLSVTTAPVLHSQAPRQCLLQYESPSGNTRTTALELPSKRYNVFQGGGVTYRCQGQDNTINADSAEYYGDLSVLYLVGSVRYNETRARVNSDRMTYYQLEDRLHAEGNVDVRLESGTTMRGPNADYYRVSPTRALARTEASGRPRMSLVQRTTVGQPGEPVDVVANRIVAEGDELVYASGQVEINRPDLIARGDSAFLDGSREFARLMMTPSIESRRDRPFTLSGGVIDLFSRNRELQRVVATPKGHALSQDLELLADSVDLRIDARQLQRVIAWGKSRARALSPEREITADSIDAIMPSQRLREVRATGDAYANSNTDTIRLATRERDWIRGDTIVAEFDSIPAADTARRPQAKRIVSTGNARSFYQIAGNTPGIRQPNINYVRGRVITILFADKAVNVVSVLDQASGLYLEPTIGNVRGAQPDGPLPARDVQTPAPGRGTQTPAPGRGSQTPAPAPTRTPATPIRRRIQ